MKMSNQEMERFDKQIENMYSILVNISSELINIKGMMQSNRKYFPGDQPLNNAAAASNTSTIITHTAPSKIKSDEGI